MSYAAFVNELVKFTVATTFRTDLSTLHTAMNTILERDGKYEPLPDISEIEIVDNQQARDAIMDLIEYNLANYGKSIADMFMIGKVDLTLSKHGSRSNRVAIDITLVHVSGLSKNMHFIEMQAAMTSEQAHRAYC